MSENMDLLLNAYNLGWKMSLKIDMSEFGNILMSYPDGRGVFEYIRLNYLPNFNQGKIILDFRKVQVISSSFLSVVVDPLRKMYGLERLEFVDDGANVLLRSSLKVIDEDFLFCYKRCP